MPFVDPQLFDTWLVFKYEALKLSPMQVQVVDKIGLASKLYPEFHKVVCENEAGHWWGVGEQIQ